MILIVPQRFHHLTMNKKILYKATHLKTEYLFYLIHHFIFNYSFDKDELRLSSEIMQKIYGMNYLRYIEYLLENEFLTKIENYSSHLHKSNKYKIIEKVDEIFVYHTTDFILNKKYRANKNDKTKNVRNVLSPIPIEIRAKLINDLNFISINEVESLKLIDQTIRDNRRKFLKNLIMILKISEGDIFFKFDKHARLHSNFTNLKKAIRNDYLKIDGETIKSLDIKSSQPFFLAQILKKELLLNSDEEVKRFINIVENADIYQYFFIKHPTLFNDRSDVKPMMFKCLFDKRKYVHHYKDLFKSEFPAVFDYIENYYIIYGEYLWKTLQRMESKFIFNTIYPEIINRFKDIKLFTVHDSIHFPEKYQTEIEMIWNQKLASIINNEK